ncbi:MAG: hypothetical protein R6U11_00165 [Bacteroidales bacterium]
MTTETKSLPSGLKVLCILSLIGGGIALFFSILALIPGLSIVKVLALVPALGVFIVPGGVGPVLPHILMIIFYALSIYGVLQMMKMKKMGFILYLIAQIAIFIFATIFNFGILSLIFSLAATLTFIFLYAGKAKQMS